jgi:hypothetical protein
MTSVRFGYAGKWTADYNAARQAAYLVKSDPTPVGVEVVQQPLGRPPAFRVATNVEYLQAAQNGRIIWTAWG